MADELDALLRKGDLDGAALVAKRLGLHRRAAELLSLAGRPAEAVLTAIDANEWRMALDIGLGASDPGILDAVCEKLSQDATIADLAAAHARLARRDDIAAKLLQVARPAEAGAAWYQLGEYRDAAACFERAGDIPRAIAALEQHLAQSPDDAVRAERLAELRATRGDLDGAVRALQSAMAAGGGAAPARKLVDAFMRLGHAGVARAVVRRLRSIDASASEILEAYAGQLAARGTGAEERYAGRYRVVREVGSGASGRVLEALDELTNESVALKVLSVGDDKGGAFGRFMREAELAKVLDDPTLVRMRALDAEGPTIVYDWMPGGTLGDRIESISLREARIVALRILQALEILHRHGVVHRDVKPSNVLFDTTGQARLGDLGAAHLSDLGATVTGGLVGSLPYMAPEQITGASATAATDVYAFGCMLFQMVTHTLPFEGPDYVTQHVSETPPLASSRRRSLGTAYDSVFQRLLEKDPESRPPDVPSTRELLLGLPWIDVDDAADATTRRPASMPPPRSHGAERFVPLGSKRLDAFEDSHLARQVERVVVPHSLTPLARAWARLGETTLQTIEELVEDGVELSIWALPVGAPEARVSDLSGLDRDNALAVLERVGVETTRRAAFPVVRNERHGLVLLVCGLAACAE